MKRLIRFVLNNFSRSFIQKSVHLFTPVAGLFYAGRRVECPICGARYRKFLPYGYGPSRSNALCPRCLSLERHRLMWLYLRTETDFFVTKPKLLHLAPEECFIKKFRSYLGDNYITADLESPLADIKTDVKSMPFEDESFDVIFCNHLLEHVDDDRAAMREIYRVMKPGGWGILLSPVNPTREVTYEDPAIDTSEGRRKAFGQYDHYRDYGLDYSRRLREAGFEVSDIDYYSALTPDNAEKFAVRKEIIYKVRKQK